MKITVITVCFNSQQYIKDAIESVINQSFDNIEYIIIDGGSTDDTVDIIKSYGDKITTFVCEPDKGIYDAMNKGIRLATGDAIAVLNSDDFYASNNVIQNIVTAFDKNKTDIIYGDLVVVYREDTDKIKRKYNAKEFTVSSLEYGIMPGHATFFIKKELFDQYGLYNINYKIAGDFDLIVRFLFTHKTPAMYLPQIVIKARTGGVSDNNIFTKFKISREVLNSCDENHLHTNLFKINLRILIKLRLLILARFER